MELLLPVVDLDVFLCDPGSPAALAQADKCAEGMIRYGALLVKDSRFSDAVNSRFLDTMEDYFAQPLVEVEKDVRPEVHFQVGAHLENTEKPKCYSDENCQAVIAALAPEERPLDLEGGKADPKTRFFRRLGKTPPVTEFPAQSAPNVIPAAFAETWDSVMGACGSQLQNGVKGVVSMLEVGLGIDKGALRRAGEYGPHLLAPACTDLKKYGKVGTIFAGFHTDIGCISVHGNARYPGLNIWARNTGKRIPVKIPSGHVLVQAGKQLQHLTGGLILAGYHEVVCTPATVAAMESRLSDPLTASRPLTRVSSTSFWQLSADYEMNPKEFVLSMTPRSDMVRKEQELVLATGGVDKYAVMKVGAHLQNEIKSSQALRLID